jgi:excisionase family DNA binding protein
MSDPTPKSKRYLSLEEVSQMYGISIRTARRAVSSGDLPAIRVGRRSLRVLESDAEALGRPVPTTTSTAAGE